MLSLDGFIKQCREHIDKGEPFLAYWHARGFALLRTGVVILEEYDVYVDDRETHKMQKRHAKTGPERDHLILTARRNGERIDHIGIVPKPRKVKAGTISGMRKTIAKMRKDPRTAGTLHVVEYDGAGVSIDGGPELEALL